MTIEHATAILKLFYGIDKPTKAQVAMSKEYGRLPSEICVETNGNKVVEIVVKFD